MNKRILALIILATMLLSTISCGDSEGGKDTGTPAPDDTTSEAAETTDYIDTLGAKDFGGKTFTILAPPVTAIQVLNMHSGEINGEVINDTQFNRDKLIEGKYNVVIDYPSFDPDNGYKTVANASLAGDFIGNIYIDGLNGGAVSSMKTSNTTARCSTPPVTSRSTPSSVRHACI